MSANPKIRSCRWMTKLHGTEFKVMRLQESTMENGIMDNPELMVNYLRAQIPNSVRYNVDVENLIVVCLNTRRRAIGFEVISNGTLDTLLVHPREVFKAAIVMGAAAIVIAHNHPSGDPTPGEADIKVTRDLIRAGQIMKIEVLDHIVLGRPTEGSRGWSSLRELGYFNF